MNNWKVEVRVKGDTEFVSNGLRFETQRDAEQYGRDLYSRWLAVEEWRAVEEHWRKAA